MYLQAGLQNFGGGVRGAVLDCSALSGAGKPAAETGAALCLEAAHVNEAVATGHCVPSVEMSKSILSTISTLTEDQT